MIQFGAWLIGIGLSDVVAGPSGEVNRSRPVRTAIAIGAGVAAGVVVALAGGDVVPCLRVGAIAAMTAWPWLELRTPVGDAGRSARRCTAALWVLAVGMGAAAASAGLWPDRYSGGVLSDGFRRLPFTLVLVTPAERIVLVAGLVLFLAATSNAVVRSLLIIIGTRLKPMEERLRGGRVIGPIERVLIFGLGLAGYATAAAIVVSAKGLLRFPELNALKDRAGGARTIDEVTEYLVVGSLTSWLLGLFALLLAG
jgi:hypothetical protein